MDLRFYDVMRIKKVYSGTSTYLYYLLTGDFHVDLQRMVEHLYKALHTMTTKKVYIGTSTCFMRLNS